MGKTGSLLTTLLLLTKKYVLIWKCILHWNPSSLHCNHVPWIKVAAQPPFTSMGSDVKWYCLSNKVRLILFLAKHSFMTATMCMGYQSAIHWFWQLRGVNYVPQTPEFKAKTCPSERGLRIAASLNWQGKKLLFLSYSQRLSTKGSAQKYRMLYL